jgi:uncharacterized protein with FMN-binding domain
MSGEQDASSDDEPRDDSAEYEEQREESQERETRRDDRDAEGVRDGSYRASGGYQSPNGPETIEVSITISRGVIESVEVIPQATNSTSKRYQGDFGGGLAAEVVGKSLEEADVTRVAGSSLTSGGFAEALQTIRQDAKVG